MSKEKIGVGTMAHGSVSDAMSNEQIAKSKEERQGTVSGIGTAGLRSAVSDTKAGRGRVAACAAACTAVSDTKRGWGRTAACAAVSDMKARGGAVWRQRRRTAVSDTAL
jgi:hypothetical protein